MKTRLLFLCKIKFWMICTKSPNYTDLTDLSVWYQNISIKSHNSLTWLNKLIPILKKYINISDKLSEFWHKVKFLLFYLIQTDSTSVMPQLFPTVWSGFLLCWQKRWHPAEYWYKIDQSLWFLIISIPNFDILWNNEWFD